MKTTAFALALAFGLAISMGAYAQTPAAPAKPAQTNAATTPAKPTTQAQAKIDCTKVENKAKDECKAPVKKP